jgi:hypothetical protein
MEKIGSPCFQDEPGCLLVFPYVDNTGDNVTILEIANLGGSDVWLKGYMITGGSEEDCVKKNFAIHLTGNEPLLWNTSRPYSRRDEDGVMTQIQSFGGKQGFCFVMVMGAKAKPLVQDVNCLVGEALVFDGVRAFRYDAMPHQRVLYTINGFKEAPAKPSLMMWCSLPLRFHAQGFSPGLRPGLAGRLAVCTFDVDAPWATPPPVTMNIDVWNQQEVAQSRHGQFSCFAVLDLAADLGIDIDTVFTAKWRLIASSDRPVWAVLLQSLDDMAWGGKVWYLPSARSINGVLVR